MYDARVTRRSMAWVVFAVAAILRLSYLAVARPPFEDYHWVLAGNLLHTGALAFNGIATTTIEPGYATLLAAARLATGDRVLFVQALQALVASLGAYYLFHLALTLTGRERVALIAGLLFAGYPLMIRHAPDPTDAALLTTSLIAYAAYAAAPGASNAAIAGGCLGLAVLTRAMTLPFVLITPGVLIFNHRRRDAAVLALVALAVCVPFGIRNTRLNGWPLPTRSGLNLFISNTSYAAALLPDHGLDLLEDYGEAALAGDPSTRLPAGPAQERAKDQAWTRLALDEVRRHPAETLRLKLRNYWYFVSPELMPRFDDTGDATVRLSTDGRVDVLGSRPRPRALRLVYTVTYVPVVLLAVWGVVIRRAAWRDDALLLKIFALFALVHAVYFPTTRYRAPVEFVLLFFAAIAIDRALDRLRAT